MRMLSTALAATLLLASLGAASGHIPVPLRQRIPFDVEWRGTLRSAATEKSTPCDTIGEHPDELGAALGVLGCPGKNIAVSGESVAVVWGSPSGDPTNYFLVSYRYSTDGGESWLTPGTLPTIGSRRVYPGVDWDPEAATLRPYFVWQEVDGSHPDYPYAPSAVYLTWDQDFPHGFLAPPVELPNSADWRSWLPCVAVKDSVVIVTAFGHQSQNAYIWRSTDCGSSWTDGDTLVNTEDSPDHEDLNSPIVRWGRDGYVFAIFDWSGGDGVYEPHYMESLDYGVSWSSPVSLWELTGGPPYVSCTGSWWYMYDCVIDTSNVPHCVWRFGVGTYEYGDIHTYRPTAGIPGAWSIWEHQCVVGDCDGTPVATQPSIGLDRRMNSLHMTYLSFWDTELGYTPDVGHILSVDGGRTWADRGPGLGTTPWYDETAETAVECASSWTLGRDLSWIWGNVVYVDESDDPRWVCSFACSLWSPEPPPFIREFYRKSDTYCGDIDFRIWARISDWGWPMDSSGIDSAWLHYWVNDGDSAMVTFPMELVDGDSVDGTWEAIIPGSFSLGDTIKYYFSARNFRGDWDRTRYPSRDDPYAFTIRQKNPGHDILFVVEDGDSIDGFHGESFYNMDWEIARIMDNLGYDCDLWDGVESRAPDSCVLAAGYDLVIWFGWTGEDFAEDSLYIADYLDQGGKLWLACQDLLCCGLGMGRCGEVIYPADQSFAARYLRISAGLDDFFGSDGAACHTENRDTVATFVGLDGDPTSAAFAEGVDSLTVYPYSNEMNPEVAYNFSGWVEPLPGAVSNFFFSQGACSKPSGLRTLTGNSYDLFLQLWDPAWTVDSVQVEGGAITGFIYDYTRMVTLVDAVLAWFNPGQEVQEDQSASRFQLALYGNRPNPVRGSTRIDFAIATRSAVSLTVYDVSGRHVKTLVDGILDRGFYGASWDGTDERGVKAASGVYLYTLEAEDEKLTRKMVLVK